MLLDQSMPGSEAFYTALRRARPDLPVIITSGYSSLVSRTRFPDLGADAFIQKPFHRQALIEILDRRLGPKGDTGTALAHN